jgi:ABC-type multidrug transport system fused ATPase/permease subunit
MAEGQTEPRKESWQAPPWTKLFSAFRIAILPSKLLLAAAGIVAMAAAWWLLSWAAYAISSHPMPERYLTGADTAEKKEEGFKRFKADRRSFNLLHELAGDRLLERDAGDIANTLQEYETIHTIQESSKPVRVQGKGEEYALVIGSTEYLIAPADKQAAEALPNIRPDRDVVFDVEDANKFLLRVDGIPVTLRSGKQLGEVQDHLKNVRERRKLHLEAESDKDKKDVINRAHARLIDYKEYKPYGRLRIWPWYEYRGPNPYLVVTEPDYRDEYASTFFGVQVPVLLEPLFKFFAPVVYFFRPEATFGIRFYLLLMILLALAIWGFFGGAITRMAVVQAARPNEKVGLFEALRFARSRFQSFFSAPLIPLVFLAVLTLFMIFLGLVMGFTFFFGDIVLAVIFWPLIFIMGLVMALVLVGLVGWPLMYATISAEGSDSFDALSRSYSYVFQAVWRYLWYVLVALVYGAMLIFFVGFMGSLLVYMGKWGVSQTPFLYSERPTMDRDPTYFFYYAPKSFGWRDLLLHGHPQAKKDPIIRPNGKPGEEIQMSDDYKKALSLPNRIGAFFVGLWLYLLFLLVLGFAYSYFWTASSIIYLLMRWKVDDTELDEIHLEEEEEPLPDMPVAVPPAPPAQPAATPGFTMVESPTLRTGAAEGVTPPNNPPPAPTPPGEPASAPPPPEPPPPAQP